MIVPAIPPLDDALAELARSANVSFATTPIAIQSGPWIDNVPLFALRRGLSGAVELGHGSHGSHTSHGSHVSGSYTPGDGYIVTPPSQPSAVVTGSSVELAWTSTIDDDSSVYIVTVQPGGHTYQTPNTSLTVSVTDGLVPCVSYTFTVTATTSAGVSAASTASFAVTIAGPPPPTTNLSAS